MSPGQPELISKDELSSSALLDAEMRIVGAELEKLEIAEARTQRPETQIHEREVHEAALKKLEQQVRVRNGVIRKLVGQLKKDGIGARTIVRNSYAGRASPSYAKKNSPRRESYASPSQKSSGIMADLLGAASPSFEPHPATFSASRSARCRGGPTTRRTRWDDGGGRASPPDPVIARLAIGPYSPVGNNTTLN